MALMTVCDLGTLQGPLLICGGSYSNLQSLQTFQGIAAQAAIPPSNIIFTGDAVAYCADPEACIDLLKTWGVPAIAGNVELQLRAGIDDCGCNFKPGSVCDRLSQQWYTYVQKNISSASLHWMQSLPEQFQFTYAGLKFVVVHGSYQETSQFIFASTPWEIKAQSFAATHANVILSGHSGLPWHTYQNGRLWINAGVLGMPANDGTARVWYATLQGSNHSLIYQRKSYTYDYEAAAQAMRDQGLPASYQHSLQTGLWEDISILPPTERAAQGQPLAEMTLEIVM